MTAKILRIRKDNSSCSSTSTNSKCRTAQEEWVACNRCKDRDQIRVNSKAWLTSIKLSNRTNSSRHKELTSFQHSSRCKWDKEATTFWVKVILNSLPKACISSKTASSNFNSQANLLLVSSQETNLAWISSSTKELEVDRSSILDLLLLHSKTDKCCKVKETSTD